MYYTITDFDCKHKEIKLISENGFTLSSYFLENLTLSQIQKDINSHDSMNYEYRYISGLYTKQLLKEIQTIKVSISFNNCFFEKSIFNSNIDNQFAFSFYECYFNKLEFTNHYFRERIDIEKSIVFGQVEFSYCTINSQVTLDMTKFFGDVRIIGCKGAGFLIFMSSTFYGQFKCRSSNFDYLTLCGSRFLIPIEMLIEETSLVYLDIVSCYFQYDITLFACDFDNLNISETYISGFFKLLFSGENDLVSLNFANIIVSDNVIIDWEDLNKSVDLKNNNLNEQIRMYRTLKESYSSQGSYIEYDEAYVKMRKCEAKKKFEDIRNTHSLIKLFKYIGYFVKWIFIDLIGNYGTSYARIMLTMIFSILIFSGLYLVTGLDIMNIEFINENSIWYEKVFGFIYYSGITFFTVGYGDVTPNSVITALIAIIESFTGVFLMSYFVVAFVRKIVR